MVYKINGGSSETVQVSTSGYTISDIASGSSLSITASADGYNTYTQTYTISFNRSISITLSAEGTEDPGSGDTGGDSGGGDSGGDTGGDTLNGDWYGNLYTGNSNAHDTMVNNSSDNLATFSLTNLWYGIADSKGMGILSGKTIKKICLYEVPSTATLNFYVCENYTSSTDVSTGRLVHTITGTGSSSKTTKEYPVNIQIPAGATLAWNGSGSGLSTPNKDTIDMKYQIKYGLNSSVLQNALNFSGIDLYLE